MSRLKKLLKEFKQARYPEQTIRDVRYYGGDHYDYIYNGKELKKEPRVKANTIEEQANNLETEKSYWDY